jgi:hypothetical protein
VRAALVSIEKCSTTSEGMTPVARLRIALDQLAEQDPLIAVR